MSPSRAEIARNPLILFEIGEPLDGYEELYRRAIAKV
jgi:hypothetical protein